MSTPMYILPSRLIFGSVVYDEMWNLQPAYPHWSICTQYNETSQKHDLIFTYHTDAETSTVMSTMSAPVPTPV